MSISDYCQIDSNMAWIVTRKKQQTENCPCTLPACIYLLTKAWGLSYLPIQKVWAWDTMRDNWHYMMQLQDICHWIWESFKRNEESVHETTYYRQNVLHISVKVKNVPEHMICYLGNIICNKAYQQKKTAWCCCIWLVGTRTKTLLIMYWKNTTMQQQYMTETIIFLSICPIISMSICQHMLCIFSWIHSGMLFVVMQTMTTHFHCITLCKQSYQYQQVIFLNMNVLSVFWILTDFKWTKWDTAHHCMPILQWKCFWLFLIYSPEAVNNMDDNGNLPTHHILKQKPLVNCNII